jgi:ribonuclease HI
METNNNSIKFIQANLNRSARASINLTQLMIRDNIDIALIQEPNTKGICGSKLPHFSNLFTHIFYGEDPKAAIIVNPRLVITPLRTNLPTLAAIRTTIDGQPHNIISAYWSRGSDRWAQKRRLELDLQDLDVLLSKCPDTSHLIIGTDANARSGMWFHQLDSCDRGRLMEDYLAGQNLITANRSSEPTWESRGLKGWNQLTITSPPVNSHVINWRVSRDESLSDHKILLFELGTLEPLIIHHRHPRYTTNNISWSKFDNHFLRSNQIIHNDIKNLTSETELLQSIDQLNIHITETCETNLRRKKAIINAWITWFNPELEQERTTVNRLCRRWKRSKGSKDLRDLLEVQYNTARKQYGKHLRDAKKESWRQFCSNRDYRDSLNSIFNLIRKLEPQRLPFIPPDSSAEWEAWRRGNEFFPDDSSDDNPTHQAIRRLTLEMPNTNPRDDPDFTEEEVQTAIRKLAPNKAPGLNGVDARILKRIDFLCPGMLKDLYNRCLQLGRFPECWKIAIAVMIPKPDSEVPRPISLLPIEGKVLESLVAPRLTWRALKYNWISPTQFAFLPGRGTYQAMEMLVSETNRAFDKREFFVVISLDIKGAYNNAWWPTILAELHRAHEREECPTNLYRLVRDFLANRKVEITYADATVEKILSRGCPQGSVLAPFLWSLALEPLLRILKAQNIFHIAYADDLIIGFRGKDAGVINYQANQALEMIANWGRDNKLTFSPTKTKAICFHRIRKYATADHTSLDLISLKMDGHKIELEPKLKYLGVVFDERLNWNEHLKYIRGKSMKALGKINRCTSAEWGLNYECRRNLYRYAFEPFITYGCPIWGSATKRIVFRRRLLAIQRRFAMNITRCFRTISTEAVLIIAELIPIDLRIQELTTTYNIRNKPDEHPTIKYETLTPTIDMQYPATRFIPARWTEETPESRMHIYTDGSMKGDKVGAAFTMVVDGREAMFARSRLGPNCSAFQAECWAIKEAILIAVSRRDTCTIYSDSEAAIASFLNFQNKDPIICMTRNVITQHKISLKWIPGHSDVWGNDRADQLAKEAASDQTLIICYDRVPISNVKVMSRTSSLEIWNDRWTNSEDGRATKKYFPTVADRLKFSTNITSIDSQILSEHARISSYFLRFNIRRGDRLSVRCGCEDGTMVEDMEHFLFHCPKWSNQRNNAGLEEAVRELGIPWPCQPRDMVSNEQLWRRFTTFAHDTGRLAINKGPADPEPIWDAMANLESLMANLTITETTDELAEITAGLANLRINTTQ